MLRTFRRLAEGIEALDCTLRAGVEALREAGPAIERLEALELGQARWEAEIEAVLLKAEGKLAAANNSEARTRTMKKSYEKLLDPFDEEGEAGERLPPGNAEAGRPEEVQYMPMDLAPVTGKAFALRAKFS